MAPEVRTLFMQEMEECISLVAKVEDVDAYRIAKDRCAPEVIQSEADPMRFLEFCDFNPWEAAKRMIEYWKFRFETFGPDRFWKRVLDVSGTEALSPGAARIVDEMEFCHLLPPDKQGNIVLFTLVNTAKVKFMSKMLSDDRKEATFYHLQLIASQSFSSTKNAYILIQVRLLSDYKFFPEVLQHFSRGSKFCFPATCKGFHMICAPKSNENIQRRFANNLLPFIWKVMEGIAKHAEHRTLDFVTWTDQNDQQNKIADLLIHKFGLQPNNLPDIAGGTWNYKRFKASDMAPPTELVATQQQAPLSMNLLDFDFFLTNNVLKDLESSAADFIDSGTDLCTGFDEINNKRFRL